MPLNPTHIVIGVCTYRRPHIVQTIEAVGTINLPKGVTISILVADNDSSPSAKITVPKAACPFPVAYIHAPKSNISIARNAILDQARREDAPYLVFIDDDEIVTEGWLEALWARHVENGDAVVVGPVRATYLEEAPAWLRAQTLHDTVPDVDPQGYAHTGYTCNVLMDLNSSKLSGLRFDLHRGRSGGEDSAFFAAYQARGGRIAYAQDALVCETVPSNRARFVWLVTRRFRMGQTHGQLISEGQTAPKRMIKAGLAAAKSFYSILSAVLVLPFAGRRNKALIRAAMHLGVISGCIGQKSITLYGAETITSGTKKV